MNSTLKRLRKNKVFGGVCAGLAQYLNIDPIILRVVFILLTLLNGIGLLIYVIFWIVLPLQSFEEAYMINVEGSTPSGNTQTTADYITDNETLQSQKSGRSRIVIGVILIGVGFIFLVDKIVPSFSFTDVVPFIILLSGVALLIDSLRKQ